jgi:hypothetical protein
MAAGIRRHIRAGRHSSVRAQRTSEDLPDRLVPEPGRAPEEFAMQVTRIAWIAAPCALIVLAWFLHSPHPSAAHVVDPARALRAAHDPARTTDPPLSLDRRDEIPAPAPAVSDHDESETASAGPEHDDRIDRLVSELEELSKEPSTYHARALPVIEELTSACGELAARDAPDGDPSVVGELLGSIVHERAATALVRGSVFLALAPHSSESEFAGVFDAWTAGDPEVPLELLRAAALAAVRRGLPSDCSSTLSLAQLAALPTTGTARLPGFYPMSLDRIAPAYACESLRRWLDRDDPRRALFRPTSAPVSPDVDLPAAAEYFVTAELLFCVWGHQSLIDPQVERAVLAEARMEHGERPDASLVCLRAAHFVVQSLALCDDAFLAFCEDATSSANPYVASVARTMESMAVGGIGAAVVSRLERLRYSAEPDDRADLVILLTSVGKSLDSSGGDAGQRRLAFEYLDGLVADPGVCDVGRAAALTAISRAASWPQTRRTAEAALRRGDDALVGAIALKALVEKSRTDGEKKVEALAVLREVQDEGLGGPMRSSIARYIDELAR